MCANMIIAFPPEYAFQMTSNIRVSLQMVERACEPRFRSMYSISKYVDIYIDISTYLERCIHLSGNPIYFGILHFEAAYHSLIQAIHFAASISEPIQKHSYQHIIQHLILYRHRYKRYTLLYRFVSGVIQVIILICNILSTILYRFRRELRALEKTIQAVSLFLEHAAWSTRSPLLCSDASVVFPP